MHPKIHRGLIHPCYAVGTSVLNAPDHSAVIERYGLFSFLPCLGAVPFLHGPRPFFSSPVPPFNVFISLL